MNENQKDDVQRVEQLPQIKVFMLRELDGLNHAVENRVNAFVVQKFNETGNCPAIKQSGNYISVIWTEMLKVDRPKFPNRGAAWEAIIRESFMPEKKKRKFLFWNF